MREDIVFVIVTVGVKKNSYALKKYVYWRAPKLAQNEFCYKLTIKTDEEIWKNRTAEVKLAQVKPPNVEDYLTTEGFAEPDTETQVLERLK